MLFPDNTSKSTYKGIISDLKQIARKTHKSFTEFFFIFSLKIEKNLLGILGTREISNHQKF